MFSEQDYERAQMLAQKEIDASLARHQAEQDSRPSTDSPFCIECGDPIPPERRRAVRATLCVPCQQEDERRRKARG